VVGHLNSSTSIPASKIYSDAGIPQISPSATNPKLTLQGFKTTFRVMANDVQQGSVIGKAAVETLGAKKIAIIDDKTAYGAGLADETEKAAKAAGATIVAREYTNDKATDFKAILTKIKAKNPDVIMYASNDPVAIAPVLKKALSKGIHVVGYDADAQEDAREFFVNQVDFQAFSETMVDLIAQNVGKDAKVAIVTSSMTAPNQNQWIKYIKARMEGTYPSMKLLDIRPSEEDQNLAFTVTQDLMKTYPEMNAVIGLSSVAFPGAADAVSQAGMASKIYVTGGSTPKAMKKFVNSGAVKHVVLWNPVDLGYAAVYVARALADGTLKPGDKEVAAGKLGKLPITGSTILLGKPFIFDKSNINDFDF